MVLAGLALRSVPRPAPDKTIEVAGVAASVVSTCCQDVTIRLEGDARQEHINRGLTQGLMLEALEARIVGQPVGLKGIRRGWSPLDPLHRMAQVQAGEAVLFSVLE